MSKTRRREGRRNLPAFSEWLKRKLDDLARAERTSLRRLIEDSGANRASLYRWQKLTNEMDGPQREQLDRAFDLLGIPDDERIEPYGYLGFTVATAGERVSALEAKMERAEAILRLDLTQAQRTEYERALEDISAAHEAALDRFFKRTEEDFAKDRERDEAERGDSK